MAQVVPASSPKVMRSSTVIQVQVSAANLAATADDPEVADLEKFENTWKIDRDYKEWVIEQKCMCPCGCESTSWKLHHKRPLLKIRQVKAYCCCCKSEKYEDTCWQASNVNFVNIQRLTHVSATSLDIKGRCTIIWGMLLVAAFVLMFIPAFYLWISGASAAASVVCSTSTEEKGGTTTEVKNCVSHPGGLGLIDVANQLIGYSFGGFAVPGAILVLIGFFCCGEGSLRLAPTDGLALTYPTGKGRAGRKRATEIARTVTREQVKFFHDHKDKHADFLHDV